MWKLKSIVKIEYSIEGSKNKGNLLRYRARKQRDEKYEKKIQRPRDLNSTPKKHTFQEEKQEKHEGV